MARTMQNSSAATVAIALGALVKQVSSGIVNLKFKFRFSLIPFNSFYM